MASAAVHRDIESLVPADSEIQVIPDTIPEDKETLADSKIRRRIGSRRVIKLIKVIRCGFTPPVEPITRTTEVTF